MCIELTDRKFACNISWSMVSGYGDIFRFSPPPALRATPPAVDIGLSLRDRDVIVLRWRRWAVALHGPEVVIISDMGLA